MKKIGKYRVLGKIGTGGSGDIYAVADDRIGKKWAMKELPKSQKGGKDGLFVLKRLDHPALPRIVEELEDTLFVYEVMDYIEGVTLKEYAETGNIRTVSELLRISYEISAVIAYLHGQEPPVIFRDIKPDNFIVTPAGSIKLVDFDIALLGEQTGVLPLGTRGYAAPEQYNGICSQAADVYSLGVTILELLSKTAPPRGVSRLWDRHTRAQIRKTAEKASSADASLRYREAGELCADLSRIQRAERIKRPAAYIGAVLLLVLILAGSVRGICRDAYREDIRRRAVRHMETAGEMADRIIDRLAEDRHSDVSKELAAYHREIREAGSLLPRTSEEHERQIREQTALYYEICAGRTEDDAEKAEYMRKAVAEIITLMETTDEEELCLLRLKAAELSRAAGDTGSAERFYAAFIESDVPGPGEKTAAWAAVICMRLYEERNIDTAREALDQVLEIEGAEEDAMIIRCREAILAGD